MALVDIIQGGKRIKANVGIGSLGVMLKGVHIYKKYVGDTKYDSVYQLKHIRLTATSPITRREYNRIPRKLKKEAKKIVRSIDVRNSMQYGLDNYLHKDIDGYANKYMSLDMFEGFLTKAFENTNG